MVLTLLVVQMQGQETDDQNFLFAKTDRSGKVTLKFLGQDVVYPDGLNFYISRNKGKSWQLLNESPLKPQVKTQQNDSTIQQWTDAINELVNSANTENKEILAFVLVLQAVEQNDLAQLMGIATSFEAQKKGKAIFKVELAKNQKVLAQSKPLKIGKPKLQPALQNFTSKTAENKVLLHWQLNEIDFYGYNIYRYTAKKIDAGTKLNASPLLIGYDENGNLPQHFFFDSVPNDTLYYYEVYGVNAFGEESQPSAKIMGVAKDLTAPYQAFDIQIRAGVKTMVSWSFKEEEDLAGFNVYRAVLKDSNFVQINTNLIPVQQPMFADSVNAYNGVNYAYYIESVDKSGNKAVSNYGYTAFLDEIPPAPVRGLEITADSLAIVLKWSDNLEPDLRGYRVYRNVDVHSPDYELLTPKPLKTNLFIDSLAKESKQQFFYKVIAMDTSFNKSKSSKIMSAKVLDIVAPSKPIVRFTNNDSVAFFNLQTTNPSDFARFEVLKISADTPQLHKTFAEPDVAFRFALLANETKLIVKIVDNSGNVSEKSEIILPAKVRQLKNIFNWRYSMDAATGTVTLSWEKNELNQSLQLQKLNVQTGDFIALSDVTAVERFKYKLKPFEEGVFRILVLQKNGRSFLSAPLHIK